MTILSILVIVLLSISIILQIATMPYFWKEDKKRFWNQIFVILLELVIILDEVVIIKYTNEKIEKQEIESSSQVETIESTESTESFIGPTQFQEEEDETEATN